MSGFKLRWVGLALLGAGLRGSAGDAYRSPDELKVMTLDTLLETRVISVSRTLEEWTTAPTAIDIITQDDIHRSGAVRLPDVLRLATGLQVSRFVDDSYAISARGFNSTAANKMQVLLDGRSLYTPLFSGVFWEIQDTLLEDIDRIEVVRGPGATMWGANAVNGVINIITKSARDTQGTLILGGGGLEENGFAGARYGGKAGEFTYYRTYLKYQNRDEQVFSDGSPADDGMQQGQGGFRVDSFLPGENLLTLQGDLYFNTFGLAGRPDAENLGGNVLGRWTHDFSDTSELQVQMYYDRAVRDVPLQFHEDRQTYDLDAQHEFELGERQKIVWGGSYRVSADDTGNDGTFQFSPESRTLQLFTAFVQDEIEVVRDRLSLFLGSKFEHNDFTGFEVQPGARLAYTPTPRQTVWAAVSRAVRTPTRVDTDVQFIPNPAAGLVFIQGNSDFESEDLIAYELGYRIQPHKQVFVDLATFYNVYDNLRTLEPTPPLGIPLRPMNEREGETYGGELAVKYQATDWWRLSASYSYLREDLGLKSGSLDTTSASLEGNDARHMATLHSALDLPGNIEFDTFVRYVDRLPSPYIPSRVSLDLRLAWRPVTNLELALIGRDLLDDRHPEFGGGAAQPEVQRAVYGKFTLRF